MWILIKNQVQRITGSFAAPYAVPLSDIDRVTIFIAANQCAILICAVTVAACLPYTVYRPLVQLDCLRSRSGGLSFRFVRQATIQVTRDG
jgi:hypothetical protein